MLHLTDEYIATLANTNGIIHVAGSPGSGKTLFAAALASSRSRTRHIDWLSTDGKIGFLVHLKNNMAYYGGIESNLTITQVANASETKSAILDTARRLRNNTGMVVIDSITRVLDMSRKEKILWGQSLFEEALPTLAGLCMTKNLCILLISETRESEMGVRAVYHEKLDSWADINLILERRSGSQVSQIYTASADGSPREHIGNLHLSSSGGVSFSISRVSMEAS
ncbi:MAG: ATP-binding protein [Candidatus Thorarchaeota archaeon]